MGVKPESGTIIAGKYRLDEPLGEGGYGAVWRATQLNLNRPVAVKLLKTTFDDAAKRRFEREATALGRLQHPGCVQMLDFGIDDGDAYLVTELLGGDRLDVWLEQNPPLEERLRVAAQVLDTLVHAHQQNIIHRDLKPPNIIVTRTFDGVVAKVLDFGIASVVGEKRGDITKTGEVFGTPGFMSPEQLRGDDNVGPPADLYAFGVVLYQMLEGHPPFTGKAPMQIAIRHLAEPAPRLTAAVPPPLADIVARLLEKEPEARYPSAQAVLRALASVDQAVPGALPAPGYVSGASPPHYTRPLPPSAWSTESAHPPASPPWGLAAVALVLVALISVILFAWLRPADEVAPATVPHRAETAEGIVRATAPGPAAAVVVEPLEEPVTPALDAGAPPARIASDGCGREVRGYGFQRLSGMAGVLDETSVLVYIPANYDVDTPHTVLMLFHDAAQTPQAVLKQSGFDKIAEEHGIVVVLPEHDTIVFPWSGSGPLKRAMSGFELAMDGLCLSPQRVLVYGHGAGGRAAESLRCMLPEVTAVATSAFRLSVQHNPCTRDVPYIHVAVLADERDPVDGGVGCLGGSEMRSLRQHDATYEEIHRCSGERQVESRHGKSACFTWSCEVPYVTCHVEGGRPFPGAKRNAPCEGPAAKYRYPEKIWEFFRAQLESAE